MITYHWEVLDRVSSITHLRAVVEECGREFTYKVSTGPPNCVYFRDGTCSCLIGHVFRKAGWTMKEIERADHCSRGKTSSVVGVASFPEFISRFTRGGIKVLHVAQQFQDCAWSWGRALDEAEKAARDLERQEVM